MQSNGIDATEIMEAIKALRTEVTHLGQRTAAVEEVLSDKVRQVAPRPRETTAADGLSEELVLIISAAIAAYLGVKPRIGQIRLLQSDPWSQQGRVTIQASRALTVHHG